MSKDMCERRRFLRLVALGTLGLPALALAGCASGAGGRRGRHAPLHHPGGNPDKPGRNGAGGRNSR